MYTDKYRVKDISRQGYTSTPAKVYMFTYKYIHVYKLGCAYIQKRIHMDTNRDIHVNMIYVYTETNIYVYREGLTCIQTRINMHTDKDMHVYTQGYVCI